MRRVVQDSSEEVLDRVRGVVDCADLEVGPSKGEAEDGATWNNPSARALGPAEMKRTSMEPVRTDTAKSIDPDTGHRRRDSDGHYREVKPTSLLRRKPSRRGGWTHSCESKFVVLLNAR